MPDTDPNFGGVELPGLCGCGHDDAYHYRPIFQQAADGSMVTTGARGCVNCRCPNFDARQSRFRGLGELAGKEYPDGGKH